MCSEIVVGEVCLRVGQGEEGRSSEARLRPVNVGSVREARTESSTNQPAGCREGLEQDRNAVGCHAKGWMEDLRDKMDNRGDRVGG
jgi:hypothetical protein